MNPVFPAPVVGPFEAATSAISAIIYIGVALAALAAAPRDPRVRLFLLLAAANIVPYLTPVLFWMHGEEAQFTKLLTLGLALSATIGGLALFHFMQTFPWRRPWIREHGRWLTAAYVVCPLVVTGLVVAAPAQLDEITPAFALTVFVIGLPALVLVGIVLPFAGLFSLYNSWLASKRFGVTAAQAPTLAILVSQLAGGVLAILIIPLLHFVLPVGPWITVAAGLVFAFGLLMPIAFAAAIWRYDVLQIDPRSAPF